MNQFSTGLMKWFNRGSLFYLHITRQELDPNAAFGRWSGKLKSDLINLNYVQNNSDKNKTNKKQTNKEI